MTDNLKERAEGASHAISEEVTRKAWEAKQAAAAAAASKPMTSTKASFNDVAPTERRTFLGRLVKKVVEPINDRLAKWGMD